MAACALTLGSMSVSAQDLATGKYYLQNVESGLYWGAGDHANWGTRAMLVTNPEYVTLNLADGKYKLESQVSNGGTAYYFNGDYMDNGSPVSLTITQSGDYYTIAADTNYFGYDGSSTVLGKNLDGSSANARWKIYSESEMLATLNGATVENPVDATFFFLDPGFGRNNRNSGAWNAADYTNLNIIGSNPNNYGCGESYHSKFTLTQTQNVPNGVYKVTGRAFYRQDGSDNDNLPYFDVNGEKCNFPLKTGSENSMKDAQASFANGSYAIDPIYVQVSDGSLTISLKCEQVGLWCIWDGIELAYYGDVTLTEVLLKEYVILYNEALAAAQAYQSADMFDEDKTTLNTAINDNTIDLSGSVTEAQLIEATADLNAAAEAAATAVNKYTTYNTANTLINGGSNIDLTSLIANPSFENNFVGWTNNGLAAQGNNSFGKTGNIYAEKWEPNGTFGVSQTIGVLPAGLYQLTADIKARSVTSARVYAAGIDQAVTIADNQNTYTVNFALDDKKEALIGFEGTGTGAGSSWLCVDNFTLKYVGALPDELTAVTGKMNATVAQTQTEAIKAYNSNKTVDNYNAAQAAIAAAQASVNAYAAAAAAIAAAKALQTNNNFVTTAAATTFAEAIAAIENQYNGNTLSNDDATAAGTTLGVVAVGWHSAATNTPASNYMISTWPGTLTVNDWSVEGESDGSNFLVPFFQDWIADGESLGAKTMTGSLANLDNGLYKVSAWVRVRAKDGTAATGATGITMDVNGGTATDVTEGTQVGETQFQLATYEAEGLVKDGILNVNFNIAEDNNISWLSFKNISYIKVRDLNPEEMAVAPTAIALYNGETEVTEAIELTATDNTVTLTPSYTPADASEGYITWASSDEAVATVVNGVVTAVASGTATITVTSTLNAEVSATATVNVSYPESTVPETVEVIEGTTKTIYTLGENIIKNGSFEYPNAVYGWTTGTGSVNAMSTDNFNVPTSSAANGNQYLQAKESKGGADAKSINTSWPIEKGKTYVFSFMIKANKQCTTDLGYIGVSLSNTKGSENSSKKLDTPAYGTEWKEVRHIFENPSEGGYEWLVFNCRWMANNQSFDNVYLAEATYTTEDISATDADYAALNAAIDAAPVLGFQAGEAAPYNNVEAAKALAAAKAIDPEGENTHDAVVAATNALTAATWTTNTEEVNAVYDGTFAAATNNGAPAGWRMSNSTLGGDYHSRAFVGDVRLSEFNTSNSGFYIRFDGTNSSRGSMYYYGDTEGYTMPLAADTYYRVTVDFAGWGSTGKPLRMNVTGPEDFTAVNQQYNTSVRADNASDAPQQFNILFKTASAGNYVINFQTPGADTNTHAVVISNVMLKKALEDVTINETENYVVPTAEKYAKVTFNRTLVEGWNGMVLPFDMSVDDVKATFNASKVKDFKSVTVTDGKATLDFEDATDVQAGKPFMMKADEAGTSYTINGVLLPATGLQPVSQESGDVKYTFTGSYAASTDLSSVVFALIQGDKYFYHNTGKPSSAKAFRAWFVNESTDEAGSRISFNFGDDVITGINEVQTNGQDAEAVYNLQGQRVVNAKKGLFIQNGKKVVIK